MNYRMTVADLINELAGLPPMMEVMVAEGSMRWSFPVEVVVDTGLASPCAVLLTSETMPASKPVSKVVGPGAWTAMKNVIGKSR